MTSAHITVIYKWTARPGKLDELNDAAALGLHLSSTASGHLPQLLAIAGPGPFFFHGNVPEELKQATEQMQLGAEFAPHAFGFDR